MYETRAPTIMIGMCISCFYRWGKGKAYPCNAWVSRTF